MQLSVLFSYTTGNGPLTKFKIRLPRVLQPYPKEELP